MSAAESEPVFATGVVDVVDELVAERGVVGAEAHLQREYGSDPQKIGRQQEPLAYLRYTYGDQL